MVFKTALIVDDSKLARVTLKKKLEAHGLTVDVADSAEQAYGCLSAVHPDIIFMDHLMPDIDGFEATRHIRGLPGFAAIPIVMCTGKDHEGYLQEALAIGANFILSKPPVDEALDAILAAGVNADSLPVNEIAAAVLENDLADFMVAAPDDGGVVQATSHNDLAVMPEGDMADYMAESSEPLTPVAVPTGFDFARVEGIVAHMLASERAAITADVLARMPAPVTPSAPALDIALIERICADILAEQRTSLLDAVLAAMPAQAAQVLPEGDMEAILSTVNASVAHQLAVNASTVKNAIIEQIQEEMDKIIADQVSAAMDGDIRDIFDLRLNVVVAEKFADVKTRLEAVELKLNDKGLASANGNGNGNVSPSLGSRVEQLHRFEQVHEEQVQLREKLRLMQKMVGVAAVLGMVAIAIAVFA